MSPLPLIAYGGDHATARLTTGAHTIVKILAATAAVVILAEIAGTCESARRVIGVLKPSTSINPINVGHRQHPVAIVEKDERGRKHHATEHDKKEKNVTASLATRHEENPTGDQR